MFWISDSRERFISPSARNFLGTAQSAQMPHLAFRCVGAGFARGCPHLRCKTDRMDFCAISPVRNSARLFLYLIRPAAMRAGQRRSPPVDTAAVLSRPCLFWTSVTAFHLMRRTSCNRLSFILSCFKKFGAGWVKRLRRHSLSCPQALSLLVPFQHAQPG